MTSRVYLAIDTTDLDAAKALATKVKTHIGGLKLGLEFFCANGHHGVHEMARIGLPLFSAPPARADAAPAPPWQQCWEYRAV